jgi:hypothetical protein
MFPVGGGEEKILFYYKKKEQPFTKRIRKIKKGK